jgi:hypothetical protein
MAEMEIVSITDDSVGIETESIKTDNTGAITIPYPIIADEEKANRMMAYILFAALLGISFTTMLVLYIKQ